MGLEVKETGDFRSVDAGTYPARCIRLIDIGTQHGEYQGTETVRKQVIIAWELPSELITAGDFIGQPYTVSRFYTASLSKKAALRKDLESWRGRAFSEDELSGFNLRNILDKCCLLSVIHNEQGRAKVGGVMALPKGMAVPERVNSLVCFDMSDYDNEQFSKLSEGIRGLIQQSDEWKFGHDEQVDNSSDEREAF